MKSYNQSAPVKTVSINYTHQLLGCHRLLTCNQVVVTLSKNYKNDSVVKCQHKKQHVSGNQSTNVVLIQLLLQLKLAKIFFKNYKCTVTIMTAQRWFTLFLIWNSATTHWKPCLALQAISKFVKEYIENNFKMLLIYWYK